MAQHSIFVLVFLFVFSTGEGAFADEGLKNHLPRTIPLVGPFVFFPSSALEVKFDFLNGWSLNYDAHSWATLYDITEPKTKLVNTINNKALRHGHYLLGGLTLNHHYRVQGTFFFCEKTRASLCSVQSVDEKIEVSLKGAKPKFIIALRP